MSEGLDFSTPDINFDSLSAPSTSGLDFSSLGNIFGTVPSLVSSPAPAVGTAAPTSIFSSAANFTNNLTKDVTTFFNDQAQINAAQANANLIKAQGQNAVKSAQSGLPSSYLLLGGGALLLVVLMQGRK
jgi:hypothetical protein